MENYLYFRKFRPASQVFTATAATQTVTITGVGGDDIDSATEIASITVTALDDTNTNVGSNYATITAAGQVTTLAADGWSITNSIITIADITDTEDGYSLETGDIVTVTLQQGLETSFAYPSSSWVTTATTGTSTVVTFDSIKGTGSDTVTITHDSGADISGMITSALNVAKEADGTNDPSISTAPTGKMISVIDGGDGKADILRGYQNLGIIGLVYAPVAGY